MDKKNITKAVRFQMVVSFTLDLVRKLQSASGFTRVRYRFRKKYILILEGILNKHRDLLRFLLMRQNEFSKVLTLGGFNRIENVTLKGLDNL